MRIRVLDLHKCSKKMPIFGFNVLKIVEIGAKKKKIGWRIGSLAVPLTPSPILPLGRLESTVVYY